VCVCACVRERERERECVCLCAHTIQRETEVYAARDCLSVSECVCVRACVRVCVCVRGLRVCVCLCVCLTPCCPWLPLCVVRCNALQHTATNVQKHVSRVKSSRTRHTENKPHTHTRTHKPHTHAEMYTHLNYNTICQGDRRLGRCCSVLQCVAVCCSVL